MYMFVVHNKEMVVHMFIAYCDPSEAFKIITKWDFSGEDQPKNMDQDEDDCLRNPKSLNEYVGIDEETLYQQSEHMNPLDMVGCSINGKEKKVCEDEDYFEDDSKSKEDRDLEDELVG